MNYVIDDEDEPQLVQIHETTSTTTTTMTSNNGNFTSIADQSSDKPAPLGENAENKQQEEFNESVSNI